jgi:hypothetical protein
MIEKFEKKFLGTWWVKTRFTDLTFGIDHVDPYISLILLWQKPVWTHQIGDQFFLNLDSVCLMQYRMLNKVFSLFNYFVSNALLSKYLKNINKNHILSVNKITGGIKKCNRLTALLCSFLGQRKQVHEGTRMQEHIPPPPSPSPLPLPRGDRGATINFFRFPLMAPRDQLIYR